MNVGTLATQVAPFKDPDHTTWMRRLIIVLNGRTILLVPFAGYLLISILNPKLFFLNLQEDKFFQDIQNDFKLSTSNDFQNMFFDPKIEES